MLKNKLWIVAALIAAFAMTFAVIGCTDAGLLPDGTTKDDGSEPKPAEDLVFEGADIVLEACGANASNVTVDGNKVTLKGNNTGFAYTFPKEAATYTDVQIFFKIVSIKNGLPGLLIKANKKFDNPVGITSNEDPEYQLNYADTSGKEGFPIKEGLKLDEGVEFDTGKWKTSRFEGMMAFQNQVYNPEPTNNDKEFTVEVLKVVFLGGGAEPVAPIEYNGDPAKIVLTKGTAADYLDFARKNDKVVDSDPSVTGVGVTISATGVVSFKDGAGSLNYKFPTSAILGTTTPTAIDIEKDFDYISVEYTITNAAGTGGNKVDTRVVTYDNGTGWAGDGYVNSMALDGSATGTPLQFQTWGSAGEGGFSLIINAWNLPTGGGKGTAYSDFDIKITKVTYTTGQRFKVSFYVDNGPAVTYEALTGNSVSKSNIPDSVTKPTKAGWTFTGWYKDTDNDGDGDTKVALTDAITGDTRLYASWLAANLPDVSSAAAANATLFVPAGSYAGVAGIEPYTYDSKKWWVLAHTNYTWGDATRDEDFTAANFGTAKTAQQGTPAAATHTRLDFDLAPLSDPFDPALYDYITITYDLVKVGYDAGQDGTLSAELRTNAGGGNLAYRDLEAGTNKTFTVPSSSSGVVAIVPNRNFAVLLRITKVELHY